MLLSMSSSGPTRPMSENGPLYQRTDVDMEHVDGMEHSPSSAQTGLGETWSLIQQAKSRQREVQGSGLVLDDGLVQSLQCALQRITLEELGIQDRKMACRGSFKNKIEARETSVNKITYLHIYEDEDVSMGIFCLPARSRIPLHDHPGMSVVSRVLFGDLHIRSFDWENNGSGLLGDLRTLTQRRGTRMAVSVHDCVVREHDTPIALHPNRGGNIHQFTALTDCAVLDLLTPPYSTDHDRDCTYYRIAKLLDDGRAVLAENDPSDFTVESAEYKGLSLDSSDPVARSPSGESTLSQFSDDNMDENHS